MIYAYYTPYSAQPKNSRRAGTTRVGSDDPSPITIYRGWSINLHFAFRDYQQNVYFLTGRTITARIFNSENVEVLTKSLTPDALVDGTGHLSLSNSDTNMLVQGLYSLVIEVHDDHGQTQLARTTNRSRPRFIIDVIDQTTVKLHN